MLLWYFKWFSTISVCKKGTANPALPHPNFWVYFEVHMYINMYITSSFLSRVELPLMTEVAVHCSGLSSRQNLLHVFNTAKFKKGLLIWMQTTVLMYSDWMVNRKKKTLWRLDVYCNNCFGMYSYRILVMIWDIISVGIFILCIFWDRKKNAWWTFFQGAISGHIESLMITWPHAWGPYCPDAYTA